MKWSFLDLDDVETIVYELASEFHPDYPDPMPAFQYLGGDYGRSRLDSALKNPQQTFDGRHVYRTIHDKAAILLWSIIKNHPVVDGNKRLGMMAAFVFMLDNDYSLFFSKDEAVEICLRIAGYGEPIDCSEVRKWLVRHSMSNKKLLAMTDDEFIHWTNSLTTPDGPAPALTTFLDLLESRLSQLRE